MVYTGFVDGYKLEAVFGTSIITTFLKTTVRIFLTREVLRFY